MPQKGIKMLRTNTESPFKIGNDCYIQHSGLKNVYDQLLDQKYDLTGISLYYNKLFRDVSFGLPKYRKSSDDYVNIIGTRDLTKLRKAFNTNPLVALSDAQRYASFEKIIHDSVNHKVLPQVRMAIFNKIEIPDVVEALGVKPWLIPFLNQDFDFKKNYGSLKDYFNSYASYRPQNENELQIMPDYYDILIHCFSMTPWIYDFINTKSASKMTWNLGSVIAGKKKFDIQYTQLHDLLLFLSMDKAQFKNKADTPEARIQLAKTYLKHFNVYINSTEDLVKYLSRNKETLIPKEISNAILPEITQSFQEETATNTEKMDIDEISLKDLSVVKGINGSVYPTFLPLTKEAETYFSSQREVFRKSLADFLIKNQDVDSLTITFDYANKDKEYFKAVSPKDDDAIFGHPCALLGRRSKSHKSIKDQLAFYLAKLDKFLNEKQEQVNEVIMDSQNGKLLDACYLTRELSLPLDTQFFTISYLISEYLNNSVAQRGTLAQPANWSAFHSNALVSITRAFGGSRKPYFYTAYDKQNVHDGFKSNRLDPCRIVVNAKNLVGFKFNGGYSAYYIKDFLSKELRSKNGEFIGFHPDEWQAHLQDHNEAESLNEPSR